MRKQACRYRRMNQPRAMKKLLMAVVLWAIVQTEGVFSFERIPLGTYRLKGKKSGVDFNTINVKVAREQEIANIGLRFSPKP